MHTKFLFSSNQKAGPTNKLQELAHKKGYRTAFAFATAISEEGIVSYGTAHSKWSGKAGKTQYDILLEIAKFLGASSVDDVFDP